MSFSNPQEGYTALLNDLQGKVNGKTRTGLNGDSTLIDFAAKWDPASDGSNNPGDYAATLANHLKVPPDTKLSQLQGRMGDFADAVASAEGYQGNQGTQPPVATLNPHPAGNGYVTPPPAAAAGTIPAAPPAAPQQGLLGKIGSAVGNFALGAAKSIPQTLQGAGGLVSEGLNQTAGRAADLITGKGFSVPSGNVSGKLSALPSSMTTPSNTSQKVGDVAGQIGQFFIDPENGVASALEDAPTAVRLAAEGLAKVPQNLALGKAQGQSNGQLVGTGVASALAPGISEGLSGLKGLIPDILGGKGSSAAKEVEAAEPDLVNAWRNGTQTKANIADTIASAAKQYTKDGIQKLQDMKDSLPDVAMPKSNLLGNIRGLLDTTGTDLTVESERTVGNLQKLIEGNLGNDTSTKGLLDLKTLVDKEGFYKDANPTGAYDVSNGIVQKVRNFLTNAATDRMSVFDTQNGTNFAQQIKEGLADATDRQTFMKRLEASILGKNTSEYVERGTQKISNLIAKSGDVGELENTKNLLSEFENRIGKPGLFTKDISAANAAQTLEGYGKRAALKIGGATGLAGLATGGGGALVRELQKIF